MALIEDSIYQRSRHQCPHAAPAAPYKQGALGPAKNRARFKKHDRRYRGRQGERMAHCKFLGPCDGAGDPLAETNHTAQRLQLLCQGATLGGDALKQAPALLVEFNQALLHCQNRT